MLELRKKNKIQRIIYLDAKIDYFKLYFPKSLLMTQFEQLKQVLFKIQSDDNDDTQNITHNQLEYKPKQLQDKQSKLLQQLDQTQNILNASIQQVQDITKMRTDILQIYNEIKQDYMDQNKKISDLQQQIDEVNQLKEFYQQYQKLHANVNQKFEQKELEEQFYSSCELLKRMKQIYQVQIKSTSYISRSLNTFLNTTNQFQQMYDDVMFACKIFEKNIIPIYLQYEMEYQSKIQRNQLFDDLENQKDIIIYEKIVLYLNTLPKLVQKRSEEQVPGILLYILGEKDMLQREGFNIVASIFERIVEMFNAFSSRFIATFKEQYSIKFVQSKDYNKTKEISIIDCSKAFVKYLRVYMTTVFEQLDLQHLYYANQQPSSIPGYHYCIQLTENFLTSEYSESLQEEKQKKLENQGKNVSNIAQKALKIAQKYYNNTLTDYFIKCKVESIKQCFNRNFSIKNGVFDYHFQQKITDSFVQILYNYLNQIHQQLQWPWAEINEKLNTELVAHIQTKHDLVTDCIAQIINLILIQQ